jgi:hypothetical protein
MSAAEDKVYVGRKFVVEARGGRIYIHPRAGRSMATIYHPVSKQEIPEYVDPFDVEADWEERA